MHSLSHPHASFVLRVKWELVQIFDTVYRTTVPFSHLGSHRNLSTVFDRYVRRPPLNPGLRCTGLGRRFPIGSCALQDANAASPRREDDPPTTASSYYSILGYVYPTRRALIYSSATCRMYKRSGPLNEPMYRLLACPTFARYHDTPTSELSVLNERPTNHKCC